LSSPGRGQRDPDARTASRALGEDVLILRVPREAGLSRHIRDGTVPCRHGRTMG
jgi:hypothetical protein